MSTCGEVSGSRASSVSNCALFLRGASCSTFSSLSLPSEANVACVPAPSPAQQLSSSDSWTGLSVQVVTRVLKRLHRRIGKNNETKTQRQRDRETGTAKQRRCYRRAHTRTHTYTQEQTPRQTQRDANTHMKT
eukprot:3542157-Rhodomonas_salina.5